MTSPLVDEPSSEVLVDITVDITAPGELIVALSAAARDRRLRHLHTSRTLGAVLGIGSVRLDLRLVDGGGDVIDPASLPLDVQRLVVAAEWQHGLPVVFEPGGEAVLGIVDHEPGRRRAEAAARSLTARLTAGSHSPPTLVVLEPGEPAPADCTALLEVGARWRGRWTPDLTRPEDSTRLHVAGRSVAGWSVEGGDRRTLVAQEVSRAVSELGGHVVGIPQPARRQ